MTRRDIERITRLLRAAAGPTVWTDEQSALIATHLIPLSYDWAARKARDWVARPRLDEEGHEYPKTLTTLTDVLSAVGVPFAARADLVRAAAEPGAQLLPDLRSPTGLTYVGPKDALPQGCVEYLKLNDLPIPERPVAQPGYLTSGAIPLPPRSDEPKLIDSREAFARLKDMARAKMKVVPPVPKPLPKTDTELLEEAVERAIQPGANPVAARRLLSRIAEERQRLADEIEAYKHLTKLAEEDIKERS